MNQLSSFQPFLIGSGQAKTGLFQYLQSWIKPEDSFDDIQDAYVNRGQIIKRDGTTLLGVLRYCNSQLLGYGTGGVGPYSGSMSTNTPRGGHVPILAGSVTVRTRNTLAQTETYTDNGLGTLAGDLGGIGTITYATGAWSITSAVALPNGSPIIIDYSYVATTASNPHVNVSVVDIGDGLAGAHIGTFTQNLPITIGSVFIVARQSNGTETYLDNSAGSLVGSLGGSGTIDYTTGAWSFTPAGGNTVVLDSAIQLGLSPANATFTIMGINQWNDESNNTFKLVVEDTRRLAVYNTLTNVFDPVCDVNETLFIVPTSAGGGATTLFDNGTTGVTPTFQLIAPLSIRVSIWDVLAGTEQDFQVDDGAGFLPAGGGGFLAAGTIDYYTGRFEINITGAFVAGWAINVTFNLQNDYFFGDRSNFFNWTNWEPSTNRVVTKPASAIVPPATVAEDPTQFQQGFLYLTNNFDPITLYNGVSLSRPAFALKQSNLGLGKNEILRALDVKTFASRLLIVRPTTTISDGNPDPQSIRWSAQFQPTNTVADIPGSGGELSAATSDWINSAKFLKDFIVVFMQNSTWTFRFTGSAFAPFQFFKINSTKNTSAPYGSIEYDDRVTAMGTRGLIYCDGVDVDRYDFKVFDLYDTINQDHYIQCFGIRFDVLNQAWMTFPQMEDDEVVSNGIILYNYVEDSWSVFNMPLSVLGIGFGVKDLTWADFAVGSPLFPNGLTWAQANFPWNNYLIQKESLRLVGGDFDGNVLQLNDGITDNGTAFNMSFTTKRYNPFAQDGQKANFGYLDVYYNLSDNSLAELTFEFFIDNNTTVAFTRTMNISSDPVINPSINDNVDYAWQRLFINVQGQTLQWRCRDNGLVGVQILGQILWASPAGRLIQ